MMNLPAKCSALRNRNCSDSSSLIRASSIATRAARDSEPEGTAGETANGPFGEPLAGTADESGVVICLCSGGAYHRELPLVQKKGLTVRGV